MMDRKVICAVIILSFWFADSQGGVVSNDLAEDNPIMKWLRQFPQVFPPSGGGYPGPGGYPGGPGGYPGGYPSGPGGPSGAGAVGYPYPPVPVRQCPKCDSSVYSYCSDKLFHDSCCCSNPAELPYQCQFADCSFLHSNTCREHLLISQCCCTNYLLKKK